MLYSKTCEYAIRASVYMARKPEGAQFTGQEIADAENIPKGYLLKILRTLKRQKILTSIRGPHGGFSLARPKKEILLKEVVFAIDEPDSFTGCTLGLEECDPNNPCPLHKHLVPIKEGFLKFLETTTLADFGDYAGPKV